MRISVLVLVVVAGGESCVVHRSLLGRQVEQRQQEDPDQNFYYQMCKKREYCFHDYQSSWLIIQI
jgi:hypothetical protein